MTHPPPSALRAIMRGIMAAFFAGGFVLHLASPDALMAITPDWVPFPGAVVFITGVIELFGAVALLVPRLRRWAGVMLAIYVLAVWPANIRQALEHIVLPPCCHRSPIAGGITARVSRFSPCSHGGRCFVPA